MRTFLMLILLLAASGILAQADGLHFPQPQFVNPIYDYFSRNYLSTSAMGRGHTGVALTGGVDSALLNPASYQPEQASLHLEALIKPPVNTDTYGPEDRFTSPVPFGIAGIGGNLGRGFSGALIYSLPKTLVMDDFSVEMNMGDYLLMRYPTFNLHQITASAGWHLERLHLGLNLHNQFYYLSDVIFLRTFERIRQAEYILRPQLGLLYTAPSYTAGLSITPEQSANWDLKYAVYDTKLPLSISVGASYQLSGTVFTADLEYENCSALDNAFQDRYTIKAGVEKNIRRFTYRLGYLSHPEVWHGDYQLPENTTANADTSLWWDNVALGGSIKKNGQHFLSAGVTWHHRDGNINLAVLQDVAGREPMTQVNLSLSLYLSAFRRKGFLYFE